MEKPIKAPGANWRRNAIGNWPSNVANGNDLQVNTVKQVIVWPEKQDDTFLEYVLEDKVTNEGAMFILSLQQAPCNRLFQVLSKKQPSFFDNDCLLREVSVYWVALFETYSSKYLQNVHDGFKSLRQLLKAFRQVWTSMFTDNSTAYFSRDLE